MAHFIAVIPQGLQDNNELRKLYAKFKRTMDDKGKETRWVPPNLWYLTIQFIGDLQGPQKAALIEALHFWQPSSIWKDVSLRVQGVGAFPEVERARVLWLGVQKTIELMQARESLRQQLKEFLPPDDREYNPHLTLARFRNPLHAGSLLQLGGRKHFGDYLVHELVLVESVIQGNMVKDNIVFRKELPRLEVLGSLSL